MDNPKEALNLKQLASTRNLSNVCIVSADKGSTPEAFKQLLKTGTNDRAVKVMWLLGLADDDRQKMSDFDELQINVLEGRNQHAAIEFVTFPPRPGCGQSWNEQLRDEN